MRELQQDTTRKLLAAMMMVAMPLRALLGISPYLTGAVNTMTCGVFCLVGYLLLLLHSTQPLNAKNILFSCSIAGTPQMLAFNAGGYTFMPSNVPRLIGVHSTWSIKR